VGFDTPETFRPGCSAERALGQRATARMSEIITTAQRLDVGYGGGRDRYDRLLVRLYADGTDVADIMINEGLARPYDGGRRRSWCA